MIDKAYRGVQLMTFFGLMLAFISTYGIVNGIMMGVLLGGFATLIVSGAMNICRNILGV